MPSDLMHPSSKADPEILSSPIWATRAVAVLVLAFCMIATTIFMWPVYRALSPVSIEFNEGWNAVFADAAFGKMPLYPPKESLLTNNYPPLSYYIVGAVGRLCGDNIMAGRWFSLFGLVVTGVSIGGVVYSMTGNRIAGALAWACCIGFMSRFFSRYVGMDEPQILAHAVMSVAFLWFVRGMQGPKQQWVGSVLLFVVAGFIKHNVVAMPFAAMLWLTRHHWREALGAYILAGVAIGVGFGLCLYLYGHDFLFNFLTPRRGSWLQSWAGLKLIQPLFVPLGIALGLGWLRRSDPRMQLCNLLLAIGLGVFFLQEWGNGVDRNAAFDFVIALSLVLGMGFALMPAVFGSVLWGRLGMALVLCIFLHHGAKFKFLKLLSDADFRRNIALHEEAMAKAVADLRAIPGDVLCDLTLSYRAGKPAVVDDYNASERIAAGTLPADCLESRLHDGRLTYFNPYGYRWAHRLPGEKGMSP